MKGKKFNAAEKHFEEKCVIWRQKIRDVEREKREVLIENQNLKQRMKDIEKENEYLREINDEIMKLNDSVDDYKFEVICDTEDLISICNLLDSYVKKYYYEDIQNKKYVFSCSNRCNT